MARRNVMEQTAAIVGVALDTLSDEQKAALVALRAGASLAHRIDGDVDELLLRWLRWVDPSAGVPLLGVLKKEWAGDTPDWLADVGPETWETMPPLTLVFGLLRLLKQERIPSRAAWGFIDAACSASKLDPAIVDDLWGYLTHSGDTETLEDVRAIFQRFDQASGFAHEILDVDVAEDREDGQEEYASARDKARDCMPRVRSALDELRVGTHDLDALVRFLERDRFRLAVLGEFKRGKSTLVNALVSTPGLMPTAVLPCTSALTELKYGTELLYERREGGPLGSFRGANEADFREQAANAADRYASRVDAEKAADRVPLWRITMTSEVLEQMGASLVDTPGLGEDYARDRIAQLEAKRADAAILVMDAEQQASLTELDLVEELKDKAEDLIIAVNRCDRIDEREWPAIQSHIMNRVKERTDAVPAERIILVSAKAAEDAMRDGRKDEWTTRIDELRSASLNHLVRCKTAIRMRRLRERVWEFDGSIRDAIVGQVRVTEARLANLQKLEEQKAKAEQQHESAIEAVSACCTLLSDESRAELQLSMALFDAIDAIMDKAEESKGSWTSEHGLFQPKKHATEVAEKAQKAVLQAVEDWIRSAGTEILVNEYDDQRERAMDKLGPFIKYVQEATGRDGDKIRDELFTASLQRAVGQNVSVPDATGVAMVTLISGVIAAVLGYIVADVILYYILGVIAGFLNPWLIAAAVVAAIPLAIFGKEVVKGWIRNKIAKEIRKKLNDDGNKRTIRAELSKGLGEVFRGISDAFRLEANGVLEETRAHQSRAEYEAKALRDREGTTDAVASLLASLRKAADEAYAQLDRLHECTGGGDK